MASSEGAREVGMGAERGTPRVDVGTEVYGSPRDYATNLRAGYLTWNDASSHASGREIMP